MKACYWREMQWFDIIIIINENVKSDFFGKENEKCSVHEEDTEDFRFRFRFRFRFLNLEDERVQVISFFYCFF